MHLQQTKKGSIKSGGPQYYFHDLNDSIQVYLRTKGAVSVALVTPYGATKSDFFALGKDHKLGPGGKIIRICLAGWFRDARDPNILDLYFSRGSGITVGCHGNVPGRSRIPAIPALRNKSERSHDCARS